MNPLKKKDDWKAACKALDVEFENDNNTETLIRLVGGALKKKTTGDIKKIKSGIVTAFRDWEKKQAAEKPKASKPKTPKPNKVDGVRFEECVHERSVEVCLRINGHNHWFPLKHVDLDMKNKVVKMPKWLEHLKLG